MKKIKYIVSAAIAICFMLTVHTAGVYATETDQASVSVNGEQKFISNLFDDDEIPEGFSRSTMYTEDGTGIATLVSEDGSVTLVYLVDGEGMNGAFYRYDAESAVYSRYIRVSNPDGYIIVTDPDSSVTVPEGYEVAAVIIGTQAVSAWRLEGTQNDFYLVYAVSDTGTEGLYRYDAANQTYIRFDSEESISSSSINGDVELLRQQLNTQQAEYKENQDMLFKIVCGLMILSAVLLLITLSMIFKVRSLKRKRRAVEEESEFVFPNEETTPGGEEIIRASKRSKTRKKRKAEEDEEFEVGYMEEPEKSFSEIQLDIDPKFDEEDEKQPAVEEQENETAPADMAELTIDSDEEPEEEFVTPEPIIKQEESEEPEESEELEEPQEQLTEAEEPEEELILEEAVAEEVSEEEPMIPEPEVKAEEPELLEEIEDYDDFELEVLDLDDL